MGEGEREREGEREGGEREGERGEEMGERERERERCVEDGVLGWSNHPWVSTWCYVVDE